MSEKKEKLKESGRIIWVYRGLPISSWPNEEEKIKQNLFKIVGFEFDTDEAGFDSIDACYPLDYPIEHVKSQMAKIINENGVPRAIIVTHLDGGSNAIDVGVGSEYLRETNKDDVLDVYRTIAKEYGVVFHYVPLDELWKN